MNTSQLECFVQVAQNLNFRRAADELHLSQPTVSKQVAALEEELGGDLFVRTTRSVTLTELGTSFLPDAREILNLSYAAAERARRRTQDALAIGYSDPNELVWLAGALRQLRLEGIHPTLRLSSRDDNIDKLARAQLDLVLGYHSPAVEVGDTRFERLVEDQLRCVVPANSPLAASESLSATDVEDLVQVVCLPQGLRRRGYRASSALPQTDAEHTTHCATTAEALCLVDAGFGYALLPSILVTPNPAHVALPWEAASKAPYGLYRQTGTQDKAVKRFAEIAREGLEERDAH